MAFHFDLVGGWFRRTLDLLADLLKLKIVAIYTGAVDHVRRIFATGLAAVALTMLAVIGFLIVHVGLFLLLPWSVPTKGWILLALGVIYLAVPLGLVLQLCSRRTWLKLTRAEELADRLLKAKKH